MESNNNSNEDLFQEFQVVEEPQRSPARSQSQFSMQDASKVAMSYKTAQESTLESICVENGYKASKGEFQKSSLMQDKGFQSMDDFIDDKLNLVADMVAHKKTLQEIGQEKRSEYKKLHLESGMLSRKNQSAFELLQAEKEINEQETAELRAVHQRLIACKDLIKEARENETQQIESLKNQKLSLAGEHKENQH